MYGLTLDLVAHIAWFEDRLETILKATEGSPLHLSLRIYLTCDPLLTNLSSTPPTNLEISHSTSNERKEILLPKTSSIHSRPNLSQLMKETVEATLAPCGRCWPVCYCGEIGGDGICGNGEDECCTTPDQLRDLAEKDGEKMEKEKDSIEEMEDLPTCCGGKQTKLVKLEKVEKVKESCCGSSSSPIDRNDIGDSNVSCGGCCASSGKNCCTGGIEGSDLEKKVSGPIRLLRNGLGVIVSGPPTMIVSLSTLERFLKRVKTDPFFKIVGIESCGSGNSYRATSQNGGY